MVAMLAALKLFSLCDLSLSQVYVDLFYFASMCICKALKLKNTLREIILAATNFDG